MKNNLPTKSVKTSSITILSLLLLSALVGVVTLAPSVRAATPTLTLSTSSGSGVLADSNTGTASAATLVTVTGTGFAAGQDNIAVGWITLSKAISAANFNALGLIRPSILTATTTSGDVTADANGWFTAQFFVPQLQAGTYNVVASYVPTGGSTTLTSGTSFTVNAAFSIVASGNANTFNSQVNFEATGFAASDPISIAPTTLFFSSQYDTGAYSGFTTNSAGSTCAYSATTATGSAGAGTAGYTTDLFYQNTGRCSSSATNQAYIGQRASGTVSVSATGGTSSITATSTFTTTPSIAILTASPFGMTTLSIGTAAGSAYVEGFNFPSSATLSGNSLTITVGSTTASTIMNSVSTNSKGYFVPTQVTWTQALPEGVGSIGLNGTTYSWANANIQPPQTLGTNEIANIGIWQGSVVASSTSGPAYLVTDAGSYKAGSSTPYITGIGFPAVSTNPTATYQPTGTTASGITLTQSGGSGILGAFASPNGAFIAWPSGASSCTSGLCLPYSYGTANTLAATISGTTGSTTITIATVVSSPSSTSYSTSSGNGLSSSTPFNRQLRNAATSLKVTGFNEGTFLVPDTAFTITLTSSSGTVSTWNTITATCGAAPCYTVTGAGAYTFNAGTVPELAGGSYTITVTGTSTGNTATLGTSYTPIVIGSAFATAGGTPGTTESFATTTTSGGSGVHGLLPSTAYSIMFDGPSGTSVGTFTSTSNGQVPPGTQFTLPAGATGTHVVDLVQSSGTSSAISGAIAPRSFGSAQYTGVASAPVTTTTASTCTMSSTGCTAGTGQGLLVYVTASASLSPNVGSPGAVVTISSSGLSPSSTYYVVLSNGIAYATFTSTATGTVPAGTTFAFPNLATATNTQATAGAETGESHTVCISATASFSNCASSAPFILQASLKLSASTATAGQTVSVTASGLANTIAYSVVFNYMVGTSGTSFSGTTVGSLVGGTDGTASGAFTVPSTAAAGTYAIQLVRTGGTTTSFAALALAPTLTVSSSATGLTTTTLTPSGSASEATVSGTPTVSQTFTNTATGSVSVYMWVSVKNSAGQTVGVFLGSATMASGATATIGAALFNLPSGSYTASVFVTTTSGVVVSTTSTTSSFSV